MGDSGWSNGRYFLSDDGKISAALTCGRCNFSEMTNGFLGVNDGLTQLKQNGKVQQQFGKAENGNLVQVAKILSSTKRLIPSDRLSPFSSRPSAINFSDMVFALGFSDNPETAASNAYKSLERGFEKVYLEYQTGWAKYLQSLPQIDSKYQAQFNMAAMILKAHEDKTIRGANIASLTVPWGGGDNANENNIGGYHLIWSRDLYQVATAYLALGDKEAALRALDFLFRVQQKTDGSFPQNSFLDGKPFWGSLQLDEVAFPLILAYQLGRNDKKTYENHVKRAADFIVKNGPITPQERWEEESGYSPSTIAAEIAGLVCAADIAQKNGDNDSANRWLKTADEWQSNIEKWTVTKTGKYSKSPYYLRITQGKPDSGEKLELNNGAGFFDERDIVDAGFLELVRLGIKSPNDPIIQNSLKVIDEVIRVETPNGDGFYRYNHDGYGEMDDGRRWNWDGKYTGKGRLWALLSGERGQFEIAECGMRNGETGGNPRVSKGVDVCYQKANIRLETMAKFANDGLMIPEQVWDQAEIPKNIDKQFVPELKFGEGTGSATPLAWSMAQFIRLAVNLKEGRNLDTPKVVYDRYVLGKSSEGNNQKSIAIVDQCEKAQLLRFDDSKILQTIPQRTQKYPTSFGGKGEKETAMRFAYFGNEKEIEIIGDFTGWKSCGLKFNKINGLPNVNLLTLKFSNTARIEYKLIVDGKWILDPLNPNKIDNGVGGENSFFTMPDYKPTNWDGKVRRPEFVSSTTFEIDSKTYGKRELIVYEPFFKSDGPTSLPVMYLQDGTDYLTRAKAIEIQENLVDAGKIKPFIMVFLNPKNRMKEYWANDDYAKFVAEEVVPVIDSKYNTNKNRDGRAIIGASLGGITAIHTSLKYPNVFGRIGGQSSSFWIDNERVVKEIEMLDNSTKFRFYLDDGTFEGTEDSRKVVKLLKAKGFDVTYVEGEAGHNWTAWKDRLADACMAIWKY